MSYSWYFHVTSHMKFFSVPCGAASLVLTWFSRTYSRKQCWLINALLGFWYGLFSGNLPESLGISFHLFQLSHLFCLFRVQHSDPQSIVDIAITYKILRESLIFLCNLAFFNCATHTHVLNLTLILKLLWFILYHRYLNVLTCSAGWPFNSLPLTDDLPCNVRTFVFAFGISMLHSPAILKDSNIPFCIFF